MPNRRRHLICIYRVALLSMENDWSTSENRPMPCVPLGNHNCNCKTMSVYQRVSPCIRMLERPVSVYLRVSVVRLLYTLLYAADRVFTPQFERVSAFAPWVGEGVRGKPARVATKPQPARMMVPICTCRWRLPPVLMSTSGECPARAPKVEEMHRRKGRVRMERVLRAMERGKVASPVVSHLRRGVRERSRVPHTHPQEA